MLAISSILVFTTTFVAVGLAVLLAYFALQIFQAKTVAEEVVRGEDDESSALLKDTSLSTIGLWSNLLQRFNFTAIMGQRLEQAHLNWSVGRLTLTMLLAGIVVFAAANQFDAVPWWAGLLAAGFAATLPYLYVLRLCRKRIQKFEEFFPDALDSLSRALRSGHPFPAAMEMVAAEAEEPVASEFRQAAAEGNFGTSWTVALNNLCTRMPVLEVYLFASAVQVQGRTGGKLNEVLGRLAENMRESVALKGEVRALATHGRLTGTILTALPILIAVIMMSVNPGYLMTLVVHPVGKYLIAASITCLVLAHLIISRIVDVKL